MIRTLIEVSGEDGYDHERQLKAALDKLGYEPKPDADHVRWMSLLWQELADRGLDPQELVAAQKARVRVL